MSVVFKVGFFGRVIPGNNLSEIRLDDGAVTFAPGSESLTNTGKNGDVTVFQPGKRYVYDLDDFNTNPTVETGIFWSTVALQLRSGPRIVLKGLSNDTARDFTKAFSERLSRRASNAKALVSQADEIANLIARHGTLFDRQTRISEGERAAFAMSCGRLILSGEYDKTLVPPLVRENVSHLLDLCSTLDRRVAAHNDRIGKLENLRTLNETADTILRFTYKLRDLEQRQGYLRVPHYESLLKELKSRDPFWHMDLPTDAAGDAVSKYRSVQSFIDATEDWRRHRNDAYVRCCLDQLADFFDTVVDGGLTQEQRRACIIDDSRSRIVAGAGSGKTTTLFAKAAFLTEHCGVPADRILAITYSNKSRKDLGERFSARASLKDVQISTIHALGSLLLGESSGKKPSLPPWVGDDALLAQRIDGFVNEAKTNPDLFQSIQNVLLFNSEELVPPYAFTDVHQYFDYLKHVKPISLRGEPLKSQQECFIANFLYVNGVEYAYEQKYAFDTATPARRQYMPDFYLPDYGIYIEHYGIGRDGSTSPDVDATEYAAAMTWKRALHAKNETVCLETFSYEVTEGTLLKALEAALQAHGVKFNPLPPDRVLELLRDRGHITAFHQLISKFVPLYKERASRSKEIEQLYAANEFEKKHLAPTLRYMFDRYESALRELEVIDFSDMIVAATDLLASGARCGYDVVLLDEAQDLSFARASLIRALCAAGDDVRLCAVGDDWQSIYRFAGSDISLFTSFGAFFGDSTSCNLTETHRFDEAIAMPTATFVKANTAQTQRAMKARPHDQERPGIVVLEVADAESDQAEAALAYLGSCWNLAGASVLIIVRVDYDAPATLSALKHRYPSTKIESSTAHSAKGLEANFVIIINVIAGWNGFPSLRPGDHTIDRLLPADDGFERSEERRLFYVAMTRARNTVVACKPKSSASPFIDELRTMKPAPHFATIPATTPGEPDIICRSCGVGTYVLKQGKFGAFASCSEYPRCRETAKVCTRCKTGIMGLLPGRFVCSESTCGYSAPECPKCRRGWLISREGPWGPFVSCSRWRRDNAGCNYTKNTAPGDPKDLSL